MPRQLKSFDQLSRSGKYYRMLKTGAYTVHPETGRRKFLKDLARDYSSLYERLSKAPKKLTLNPLPDFQFHHRYNSYHFTPTRDSKELRQIVAAGQDMGAKSFHFIHAPDEDQARRLRSLSARRGHLSGDYLDLDEFIDEEAYPEEDIQSMIDQLGTIEGIGFSFGMD